MEAIEKLPILFEIWHGPKAYNTMFCKDFLKDWAPQILLITASTQTAPRITLWP